VTISPKQLKIATRIRFPRLRDFISLTRADRPIGTYLLLWPTLAALWIASEGIPPWGLLVVFTLGTILTRSAGCIINDLADLKFDGDVKRTRDRPLVSGKISRKEALLLAGILACLSLALVLTTNAYTVYMSFFAATIAIIYPFMKRYTYLPQAVLGIAFSWGIPMTFTAVNNQIDNVAWLLLVANLLWVIAYDTQYAMVDRDDDVKLGIKSTAILFGKHDLKIITLLQVLFILTLMLASHYIGLSFCFYLAILCATALFAYQNRLTLARTRDGCFKAFLNNHWVGLSIFLGIIAHYASV